MSNLRIVFAGTPEFALPSLNAIKHSPHQLVAVYTQPDRPAGRGCKLQQSPVKNWASINQLPIVQPVNFKQNESVAELAALNADIFVVIAYGLLLPKQILELPRLGCINVHASLLPRWRGASPIQQAILHGDKQSGVTIMQMDVGLDTGDMLNKVSCPIAITDTAATLHDRLAQLATTSLLKTLAALANGVANREPQDNNLATHAGKISKDDAAIDWHRSAKEIDQQIRAFNPWPIAHTKAHEHTMRIYRAHIVARSSATQPGTILNLDKHGMLVATATQPLMIETIQFPGSKAMAVADWLNAGRSQLHVNLVLQ